MTASHLNILIHSSRSPEVRLPDARPLTLTRNFAWILLICVATLMTVPLAIAWTAGLLLN